MSNFKPKKTGLYEKILFETDVDICGSNLILFSIDVDFKNINYVISKTNFKLYLLKLKNLFITNKNFELKDAKDLLGEDIYKVYKTKVSLKRIPQIILNVLVKENFLYSDNEIDYEVKENIDNLEKIINKYCK